MNQTLIQKAQAIHQDHMKGNLTSSQYFAKLASLGKKYNVSVFEMQKHI